MTYQISVRIILFASIDISMLKKLKVELNEEEGLVYFWIFDSQQVEKCWKKLKNALFIEVLGIEEIRDFYLWKSPFEKQKETQ